MLTKHEVNKWKLKKSCMTHVFNACVTDTLKLKFCHGAELLEQHKRSNLLVHRGKDGYAVKKTGVTVSYD